MNHKKNGKECKFNPAVTCADRDHHGRMRTTDCSICAWNPEVAKARLEQFCAEHGIPVPSND